MVAFDPEVGTWENQFPFEKETDWRDHLPLDARIEGPALIEQMDTTILVEPGCFAVGDEMGNLVLEVTA